MTFHIEVDTSEWMDMLDRHEQVHPLVAAALDGVLQLGFGQTQAITHVITGRLKASGSATSSVRGEEWHGEVEYDAMHHGRYYGGYERRRRLDHDFLAPMFTLDDKFRQAMLASVEGE